MNDVLKWFRTYVENTKVWKGYDWVVLPNGKRVKVPAGKYCKIQEISPGKTWHVGFEDLTEEIGETPDYDYDEPAFTVTKVGNKYIISDMKYIGDYISRLYFGKDLIAKGGHTYGQIPGRAVIEVKDYSIPAGLLGGATGALIGAPRRRAEVALTGIAVGGLVGKLIKGYKVVEDTFPK